MAYNLAAAAAATGMNKSIVLSAINSRKISASLNSQNEWEIDPAELHRVYPQRDDSSENQRYVLSAREIMEALHRATAAETEVIPLRSIVEDLKRDWEDLAQRLPSPKPWWQWLRSTG